HQHCMSTPSDISPVVESIFICFCYFIGIISLIVNTATLVVIVKKSSALIREVKIIIVFQQVSFLLSNAFSTLLFIPFFYTRIGSSYLVFVEVEIRPHLRFNKVTLKSLHMLLIMSMIASFGMTIIVRHQLLISDSSAIKMRARVRY
ncbi:hypothetical protein PMAYCL1PPCAC_04022, partial [Pristionchus mayeri]